MKKQNFIGGKVRARNGRFMRDMVVIDVRHPRTAPVISVPLSRNEAIRLITAIATAINNGVR